MVPKLVWGARKSFPEKGKIKIRQKGCRSVPGKENSIMSRATERNS